MNKNKRFKVHIKWFNRDKTEGEITLKDYGQPLLECECIEDVQMVKDLLNELADENEQLKQQLTSISQLIDNKIDEFKNGDYGDLPCNAIHMFLDLKEEIGDYNDRE